MYELKKMWKKVGHFKLPDQDLSNKVKKSHRKTQDSLSLGQYLNQGAPEYNSDLSTTRTARIKYNCGMLHRLIQYKFNVLGECATSIFKVK
jgi:hypothetical protein